MKGPPRDPPVAFRVGEEEAREPVKELLPRRDMHIPGHGVEGRGRTDKDQLPDAEGVLFCQGRGDGGAVGMCEDVTFGDSEGVEDPRDESGLVLETVVLLAAGTLGETEAVQVDRDDLEPVLEERREAAEGVMRGGQSVEQNRAAVPGPPASHGRAVRRSRRGAPA